MSEPTNQQIHSCKQEATISKIFDKIDAVKDQVNSIDHTCLQEKNIENIENRVENVSCSLYKTTDKIAAEVDSLRSTVNSHCVTLGVVDANLKNLDGNFKEHNNEQKTELSTIHKQLEDMSSWTRHLYDSLTNVNNNICDVKSTQMSKLRDTSAPARNLIRYTEIADDSLKSQQTQPQQPSVVKIDGLVSTLIKSEVIKNFFANFSVGRGVFIVTMSFLLFAFYGTDKLITIIRAIAEIFK